MKDGFNKSPRVCVYFKLVSISVFPVYMPYMPESIPNQNDADIVSVQSRFWHVHMVPIFL